MYQMSVLGNSKNKHPSIVDLLKSYPGESNAKILIRRLAKSKIAYARKYNWDGPPFCPKVFCSLFGIRCQEVSHDIGGDGRILMRSDGKPLIEYAIDRLPERKRFTIFHEFAHTLFPDYCDFLPLHHSTEEPASDQEKEFERLCDIGAAEMLFPEEEFISDLKSLKTLEVEALHSLRKRYEASIDATTMRVLDLAKDVPCAAVFLTDQKEGFPGMGPLWVRYSSKTTAFKSYVRPGNSPPRDSVAIQCYAENMPTTAFKKETWWLDGQPRTWLVQAAKLPDIPENPRYPKVLALLFNSSYRKD